ncbi:hypothetical protein M2451_000738 [Dysgonomonas sp. PFB1-18]|uniref:hypothetical protein n=1 Tax=unclassified Dysgonomonas TaxID=2630389 RepID=UPI002473D4A6|nr:MULTISPECIES: hypothetical protein [unclassified Dysgonomonas]MDH6308427.1 hypothetical protein [Dysgonomonas sp. PF1-14]MDH6337928.1 hypothetical protein [Dysgonomonas sp. PF1-16]MDH6379425.1 hypothetical protein [Dysgonomonas sp. PFB1-18]MDH6396756.1 hypothetical protein [Dysgonomonas sp. PF1-23]
MKNNSISPLDELRQEKEIVRRECKESEERLTEQWNYLSDNAPTLLLNGAVNGIASWLGFGTRIGQKPKEQERDTESSGFMQNMLGGLTAYYPLIWEMVQPMLWRFAIKKVKSLFTKKKKKKRSDDDD